MRAAAGLVLGLPLSWVVACSAASNSTSPTGSGPGGAGGTGGAGGSGGTGATQGSGGGGSAGTGATCNQRTADPNDFPACSFCAGGRCVQTNAVPESARPLLAQCDPANYCVPEDVVATRGNVRFQSCRSILGAEGRCASMCIPQISQQQQQLPKDNCPNNHLCAPCYDPRNGESTQLCNLGCDPGPTEAPKTFATCCAGAGLCVPEWAIPQANRPAIGAETCPQQPERTLCAPKEKVQDLAHKYPACRGGIPPAPLYDGACVSGCVVDASGLGLGLLRGDCASTADKCVPCVDPVSQQRTGACD